MTRMIIVLLAALWFAFWPHAFLLLAAAAVAGLLCGLAVCVYMTARDSGMSVSPAWRVA